MPDAAPAPGIQWTSAVGANHGVGCRHGRSRAVQWWPGRAGESRMRVQRAGVRVAPRPQRRRTSPQDDRSGFAGNASANPRADGRKDDLAQRRHTRWLGRLHHPMPQRPPGSLWRPGAAAGWNDGSRLRGCGRPRGRVRAAWDDPLGAGSLCCWTSSFGQRQAGRTEARRAIWRCRRDLHAVALPELLAAFHLSAGDPAARTCRGYWPQR